MLRLLNPHLAGLTEDHLHHLGIVHKHDGLFDAAGNRLELKHVKFVLTGGSSDRIRLVAEMVNERVYGSRYRVANICSADRYVLYVVGAVLCVNHGIGMGSMSVVLHEVFKLLAYARCVRPVIFRIGTSGGIGCAPGSVVVSTGALDGLLRPSYQLASLGRPLELPALFDQEFIDQLVAFGRQQQQYTFPIITGTTVGTNDFYEAQGRLDGAFCEHGAAERQAFLRRVNAEHNVVNFEMEAPAFAAYTRRAGIRSAIVCTTLLDRLQGDQPKLSHEQMLQIAENPIRLVIDFIEHSLAQQ